MRKVVYTTIRRPTVEAKGLTEVAVHDFAKDGETLESSTALGTIERAFRTKDFEAFMPNGDKLGVFSTRAQAGEALKKKAAGQAAVAAPVVVADEDTSNNEIETAEAPVTADLGDVLSGRMVSRAEAAAELGISRGALSKRISRGSLKTTTIDGTEYVVLD